MKPHILVISFAMILLLSFPLVVCADEVENLIKQLNSDSSEVCESAVKTLLKSQNNLGMVAIAEELCKSDSRYRIKDALVKTGTLAVAPLIDLLKHTDEQVRSAAASCLGEIGNMSAVEPLIVCLKDESSSVREEAAKALGNLRATKAVDSLLGLIRDNILVRQEAIEALGKIGDERAVPELIDALKETIRQYPTLDNTCRVSQLAAALGRIKSPEAIPILVSLLGYGNSGTRSCVAEALDSIGYIPASDTEKIDFLVAKGDWLAIAKMGKPALKPTLGCLKNGDPIIRAGAAEALGDMGDVSAVDSLIAVAKDSEALIPSAAPKSGGALNGRSYDDIIRETAIKSLGKLGDRKAIVPLSAMLPEWGLNKVLAESLKRLEWKPQTEREKLYTLIGEHDKQRIEEQWDLFGPLLLEDVESGDRKRIYNAICSIVSLGKEDLVDDLLQVLRENGTRVIAEIYLNSGNLRLRVGAESWAKKKGYQIVPGGSRDAGWRSW